MVLLCLRAKAGGRMGDAVVHTPSAGVLKSSEVLPQLGNPLRCLGRVEVLWRERWLLAGITTAGGLVWGSDPAGMFWGQVAVLWICG